VSEKIEHIFFMHGKGGSSNGTIKLLRDAMLPCLTDPPQITLLDFPSGTADEYYAAVLVIADKIPRSSMLVGVSLGGLVAAKLQQDHRSDLTVVTLASPTYADGISLTKRVTPNLYALYSHADPVVGDRTNWGDYTSDHADVDWMDDHNLDPQKHRIALLLSDFIEHGDFKVAVKLVGQGVSGKH
jgi:pimeloyl-ACP methyl ester carboxylesterase